MQIQDIFENVATVRVAEVLAAVLVVTLPLSYSLQADATRAYLMVTFLLLLFSLIAESKPQHKQNDPILFVMLLLVSTFYLLYRIDFGSTVYFQAVLMGTHFTFAKQIAAAGHFVYSDPHAYFFLPQLILHYLSVVCGIPSLTVIYITLAVYVVLTTAVSFVFMKVIKRKIGGPSQVTQIFPAIVALLLISFCFSERSGVTPGGLPGFSLLLVLVAVWLLAEIGFRNRRCSIVMILLTIAIAFGSTDATLIMIPFFLAIAVFLRSHRGTMVYGLIPLWYMVSAGYAYTLTLKGYGMFAWKGFEEFLISVLSGELPARILPWQRTITLTQQDAYVATMSYLSLMLLALLVSVLLLIALIKRREKRGQKEKESYAMLLSAGFCFWIMFVIAVITYLGASTLPETVFSDIRTIAIFLMTLMLPCLFLFRHLLERVTAKKLLTVVLVALMVLASLRTVYEVYPKSTYDPINVAEDGRTAIPAYLAGEYVLALFPPGGGLVMDYKIDNRWTSGGNGGLLLLGNFSRYMMTENPGNLNKVFPNLKSVVLAYDKEGLIYPSQYTSPQAYSLAYNYSMTHNIVFDNGHVVISVIS